MAKEQTKNLHQKLLEVSKAIIYLKKDKQNKMQGYNYLSEAKIKEVIKSEFEKQGILFNYSTHEVSHYEISPTHKGTKQFCTIALGHYSFLDVDSKEEKVGSWAGSGTDTGDKGLYKAITGGIKYVLNTNFLIPSGDDPEDDHDTTKNKSNSKGKEEKTKKYKPDIPDPKPQKSQGNKSGKMTKPQRDHLDKIMKSHLLNDKEKDNLADMRTFQDANDFLGNWWDGKDGKAGERTRREYIEAYLQAYMKQESKTSLSDNFKKVKYQEARAKMEGLSASQVKALTKELKE